MWLKTKTLTNAIHYVSLYLFTGASGIVGDLAAPEVSLNGRAFYVMSIIGGRNGGWVRYGVQIPAADASGSTRLDIRMSTEADFYVDAVQVEANSYGTTYIDGDRGALYKWSGLRHGSASTRSAQERTGGRERNLYDDYAIDVVEGTKRIGTPPLNHNLQSQSLMPGALYQGVKVFPREVELHMHYEAETWEGFLGKRNDLIDLLKPDLVRGSQPIVIGYAGPGTDKKVWAQFYYNGGMEFGDFLAYDEVAQVRLLAPDPFWYADDQETQVLDYQDSVTSAGYAMRRHDGQWKALSSGFNGAIYTVAVDKQRGRVYFGGAFTTPHSRICYWDGTRLVAMGNGIGNNSVTCIAVAPNGDVWVGGDFTVVDGTGSRRNIARWNIATGTWTNFGTTGTGTVYSIAIDPSTGYVYALGYFTNWGADADQDYVTRYDGSSWLDVGTSPFSGGDRPGPFYLSAIFAPDGYLYVGSDLALRRWDGSTWTSLGATDSAVNSVVSMPNGDIVIGGSFTTAGGVACARLARYSAGGFQPLGSGNGATVYGLAALGDGRLLIGGIFAQPRLWNGSVFTGIDTTVPGTTVTVWGAIDLWGDWYISWGDAGTPASTATASGLTTATNSGSTAAFPRLTVINGNSSGSCTLQWFENQSSAHRMYFNLAIQPGETVTLDLANSQKRLTSDWRGVITNNPLQNSDVTNWQLLPGANTIATFITGAVTSVTALLHWQPRYWSADGAA